MRFVQREREYIGPRKWTRTQVSRAASLCGSLAPVTLGVGLKRNQEEQDMTTVSIVYHLGSGHTLKMAEAVHAGAASIEGVDAHLLSVEGRDIAEGRWKNDQVMEILDRSDAIIFGSPTYMGCVSGQMKSFLDATAERYFSLVHGTTKWHPRSRFPADRAETS
jgi:hypothetical protein